MVQSTSSASLIHDLPEDALACVVSDVVTKAEEMADALFSVMDFAGARDSSSHCFDDDAPMIDFGVVICER